jgi:4-amino-4-deoxychorismate lyase
VARLLVDGEARDAVPADDRGLAYGDGVFRTVRVDAGRRWLWDDHLDVLARDAGRLGIPVDDALRAALDADARTLAGDDDGVLRLTLTRGSGPRGYRPPVPPTPRRLLAFTPLAPPALDGRPLRARLCTTPLAVSPALAGVKHLGRLEQVLAAAEWDDPAVEEGLMGDGDGRLLCGTRSNLFLREGRRLLTPDLARGGVAGVVRTRLLDGRGPAVSDLADPAVEETVTRERLAAADEVFLTNAVFGVRPLAVLEDGDGGTCARWSAPGPLAARLAAAFAAETAA